MLACVFEEFILRCWETWSRMIDGTCLLIMNLNQSSTISLSTIVTYPFLIIVLSKLFPRVFSASTSEMAATDSVESVNWPAAILDSQCRWTLGESLTHSQSDDRRSLNLDIEGLVSNKMHRLCRRDLEGAVPLYNCYYDERTEESKHWHVRLKTERPCGLGMS